MAHSVRKDDRRQRKDEFGMRTRRRPIGRDYAAAKDAEVGKSTQRAKSIAHCVMKEGRGVRADLGPIY